MKLSEFETSVLDLMWTKGEASAPQIHESIKKRKNVAYSTVKTIIDRLEQKRAIERSSKQGRTIFYRPVLQQEAYSKPLITDFLRRVLGGKTRPMINHLFSEEALDSDDIEHIELLLEKRKRELKGQL